MDSIQYSDLFQTQLLTELIKPQTIPDYISIGIFSLVGATYLTRGLLWDKPDAYQYLLFQRPQVGENGNELGQNIGKRKDVAATLDEIGKNIVIFWGSQSGTSEILAHSLRRDIHNRFGEEALVADLSDYDPETISLIPQTKLAIFILSTYGEGDPSDNAVEFWDWITTRAGDKNSSSPSSTLSNLKYVAIGLGNKNYKFYNRVVDWVVQCLDQLNARRLMPVGKADDSQGTTKEDFMEWKSQLFRVLEGLGYEERPTQYAPTLKVEEDPSLEPIDLHNGEPQSLNSKNTNATSPVRSVKVLTSKELFNSETRNCLHMQLDISEHRDVLYKTGDHVGVWPINPDGEVNRLLQVLKLEDRKDIPISIKSLDATMKVTCPTPTTVEALFRYYLEICGPVSRDAVLGLVQFAPSLAAKSFLEDIGRDKSTYADFLQRTSVNLGRLLQLASPSEPWSTLPLSYLVESLLPMQPRYYSISSSSIVSPRNPTITAVVSTTGDSGQKIHGLATNYMLAFSQNRESKSHPDGLEYQLDGPSSALQAGSNIFATFRRSTFKLPTLSSTPLIMIAAGTGIAPFRAFLMERSKMLSIGKPVGEMLLFFGCRHPDEDFIYRDELEAMSESLGGRLRIVNAFSRFNDEPKAYVQDKIAELGGDVVRLLDDGATLFICGRVSMSQAVAQVIGRSMKDAKGWSETDLDEWYTAIKRRRKWQEDVWS